MAVQFHNDWQELLLPEFQKEYYLREQMNKSLMLFHIFTLGFFYKIHHYGRVINYFIVFIPVYYILTILDALIYTNILPVKIIHKCNLIYL